MVNLEDFDDVLKAIREYDYGVGVSIDNLYTSSSDCKVDESEYSYLKNSLRELTERLAKETLLQFKKNEVFLKDKEIDEKWRKYEAIPEEDRDAKADAYEAYNDAEDEASDLRCEIDNIEYHIEATMSAQYCH